ncbi:nuclear transport factor 2 family protein [Candidatus Amarobacter glycogenicus]|uniref:nuclear transport factor 2 family protein n=1 Tax=Candidatus Amarobacter glycogenicus TaxID=3140699 RepID=UPI00313501AF|nr:nuclear transport factor 2 family protein [Dehalococcoidia bacterium]
MSLAENTARIAGFLASVRNPRFEYIAALAEGNLYASAYQFSFEQDGREQTLSGIEIFKVEGGKITETWNSPAGQEPGVEAQAHRDRPRRHPPELPGQRLHPHRRRPQGGP